MNYDMRCLLAEFYPIKDSGWVKSIGKGYGSSGTTFENLIGKKPDFKAIPDYKTIEIKTHRRYSKGKIPLFCSSINSTFTDSENIPKKVLYKKYGYPSKGKNKVSFCGIVNAVDKLSIGKNYKFKLYVDYDYKKVSLLIYTVSGALIDNRFYWSFEQIKKMLLQKSKTLAIIITECKNEDGNEYFKYNYMNFYSLKNFETFLKLLEEGYITVKFNASYDKSKKKYNIHDHGTTFCIDYTDIELLYSKIKTKKDIR